MSILNLDAVPATPPVEGAGFAIRALARLIDNGFYYALAYSSGLAGGLALSYLHKLSVTDAAWPLRVHQGRLLHTGMAFIAAMLYQAVSEAGCGASLGKYLCRLRVLTEDLAPCDFRAALIRSAAYFVDALFFGIVGYLSMNKTALQQRHGDHWAKTIVVPRAKVPAPALRSGSATLDAIFFGSLVYITLSATTLILTALR